MSLPQVIRDKAVYTTGWLSGRSSGWPGSFSDAYALVASKFTSLLSLPLPFLSFLAFPFFGGKHVVEIDICFCLLR